MIGYGEGFGVDVKYSPVKYDALSTGSADSALRLMEYWDISQPALVFPTDSDRSTSTSRRWWRRTSGAARWPRSRR